MTDKDKFAALLSFDAEAGKLWWKPRVPGAQSPKGRLYSAAHIKWWNKMFAGKEALAVLNGRGYYQGAIDKKPYYAHRVLWLLHTGAWPPDQLDHINGIPTDNRLSNLRPVSLVENCQNNKRVRTVRGSVVGVGWHEWNKKWRAHICINYKRLWLGNFDSFDEAVAARRQAEIDCGRR